MKKRYNLILLAISSFLLFGCGSNNDNYNGPVQGTALVASANKDSSANTSTKLDASSEIKSKSIFGEDKRFIERTADVNGEAKYISSPAIEYNFGNLIVNGKGDWREYGQPVQTKTSDVRIVPFHGWVRYPQSNLNNSTKKFPIIIFLHGQHVTSDPSYKGYDYLAKSLAEQGYVVMSIDANDINGTGGDSSSQSRGQLVLGTLDKLEQLDRFGGAGLLTELKGKLDFNSIGIMGHSRGGQGIYLAIKFNTSRFGNDINIFKQALLSNPKNFRNFPDLIEAAKSDKEDKLLELMLAKNISFSKTTDSIKPYNFKAAFALAPTDFEEIKGITNVPVATLLPSCDGDVSNLQGVNNYDNNRFSMKYDTAPKFQILVRGANHNFYNTTWLYDDYSTGQAAYSDSSYCNASRPDTVRLNPVDQRNMGQFIINSFMRYFVGDEKQFKSYWNAVGQLPQSACPKGDETCDERAILTLQKNGSKLIQRFEDDNALSTNLLGGLNKFSGFLQNGIVSCKSYIGRKDLDKNLKCSNPDVPKFYQEAESYTGGLVSSPDQLQLSWEKPNPVYSLSLNNLSTQGYDSLTFRVALPVDVGQELNVELTDLNGKTATVTASDFSDAFYTIPRKKMNGIPLLSAEGDDFYKGKTAEALNMVSIPLKAFKGIDPLFLSKLSFSFPKSNGTVVMNDIQLQKLRD
ncbi:MAG: hypothetical protein L0G93_18395 [Acinetobacter sp.]|nr:hypothetical protein [Acinetobacter sp.]